MIARDDLAADIEWRLTDLIATVDDLIGLDDRATPARVAEAVTGLVDDLTGLTTPVVDRRRAVESAGRLVDLDDPDDARSPLGIVIGLTRVDAVTQSFAAAVLGVSRARVNVLTHSGRLVVVDVDGVRCVTRSSLAARLAGPDEPDAET
jgi:hypothetical protein